MEAWVPHCFHLMIYLNNKTNVQSKEVIPNICRIINTPQIKKTQHFHKDLLINFFQSLSKLLCLVYLSGKKDAF